MTFNEFQRELVKREIPANQAYVLTLVYERLTQVLQQQDEMAKLLVTYADSLMTIAAMTKSDQATLRALARRAGMIGKERGIDVESVANEPE